MPDNRYGNYAPPTCMSSRMLLNVRELLEGLVAVLAHVLADVGVDERVLCQLLGRRERLVALGTFVGLLL